MTGRLDRRHRGQQGYTLLELLIVVAVGGMLVGPVFAWMILVMRQQPVQRDSMVRTAEADLLRTRFTKDLTSAGAAISRAAGDPWDFSTRPAEEDWSTWVQECRSTDGLGESIAVLVSQGERVTKTVYSVAPMKDGNDEVPGRSSLWRTECAAETGDLISVRQVVEDVDPAGVSAQCHDADQCRGMKLSVKGIGATRPLELFATRRTDRGSLAAGPDGNFLPVARIRVVSESFVGMGAHDYRVDLSADASFDKEDGSTLTYRWELPAGPGPDSPMNEATGVNASVVLNQVGSYWVRLTVTDSQGAQKQSYVRITVPNRRPFAVATVTPQSVIAGQDTLTLSAAGSHDPDGAPLSYLWRITSEDAVAEGLAAERTTAEATFEVPAYAIGPLSVVLVVTDSHGATATDSKTVSVTDPTAPVDPPPTTTTLPSDPGAPVAVFTAAPSATTVTFDAGGSSGTGLSYTWDYDLVLGQGQGNGVRATHTYPGPGSYTTRLTVTDPQGRTSSASKIVDLPGAPETPVNVRVEGGDLVWDPRPGARRYLVTMSVESNGCARDDAERPVAAGPSPRRAIPPSPCVGANLVARGRVQAEGVGGARSGWSEWVDLSTAQIGTPGGEVVK